MASEMEDRVARAMAAYVATLPKTSDDAPFIYKHRIELARAAIAAMGSMQSRDTAPRDGTEFLARVMDRHPFSAGPEYRWDIARWTGKTPDSQIGNLASRSGSIVTYWMTLPSPPERVGQPPR
jgi:hypothetical protein